MPCMGRPPHHGGHCLCRRWWTMSQAPNHAQGDQGQHGTGDGLVRDRQLMVRIDDIAAVNGENPHEEHADPQRGNRPVEPPGNRIIGLVLGPGIHGQAPAGANYHRPEMAFERKVAASICAGENPLFCSTTVRAKPGPDWHRNSRNAATVESEAAC